MNDIDALKHKENEGFALRLKSLRKQKNLSQTELGKLSNLHYTHIGRYERGKSLPASDTLQRLADVLGVSGDYLMEGSTDDAAKANFEDRGLLKRFQDVEKLSSDDKKVIKTFLDAFLAKKQLEILMSK